MTTSMMHCTFLISTFYYIFSPQKVYFACIFQLSTQIICDEIQKQSSVCVCHLYKLQIAEKEKKYFLIGLK